MSGDVDRVISALQRLSRVGNIPVRLSGLHKGEFALLSVLWEHEPHPGDADLTTTHLSRELGISPAGVSQVVKTLASKGYVCRIPDENDRRVVRVKLTEAGREQTWAMQQNMASLVRKILDDLGPGDAAHFTELFERVSSLAAAELVNMRTCAVNRPGNNDRKEFECGSTSDI